MLVVALDKQDNISSWCSEQQGGVKEEVITFAIGNRGSSLQQMP